MMKTLLVSLVALAAVSGTALAAGGDAFRDSDYTGNMHQVQSQAMDSEAFAVVKGSSKKPAAFERMNLHTQDRDAARGSRPAS